MLRLSHLGLTVVVCGIVALAIGPWRALHADQPVYLRANQVGYLPNESKIAFALTNEDLGGQSFAIVNAAIGRIAYTGVIRSDRGPFGSFAHLYELNSNGSVPEGTYRFSIGSNLSPPFTVATAAYAGVISPSLQFFRVQRCGDANPLLHAACHLTDGTVANGTTQGRHINATGGWHDAGDYLKFVTTTALASTMMLHAYQRHPEVFAAADGDRVPDVIQEARVGLDWLLKMWDPTSQVLYYQVGDYHDHSYGWRTPEGDDGAHPNRPVFACEPGHGANVAGNVAAALALASSLWNDPTRTFFNPALGLTYLTAAQQIYAYGKARPAVQPSTSNPETTPPFVFYGELTWQDKMALAAAELYRATGNSSYLDDARTYATAVGSAGEFNWAALGALAHYEIARLDGTYTSAAMSFLSADLTTYQSRFNDNRFREAVSSFEWGSAETMLGAALTAIWYEDLTGDSRYRVMALAQRDYVLGSNPWGVSFVNSVGTTWPHHPHHQVADLASAELVGFWDEGPVALARFNEQGITLRTADRFAAFQSTDAVYHDDTADYVTNEPTLSMNALGISLTSWFMPVATSQTQTHKTAAK